MGSPLSHYFSEIAAKRLSTVEIKPVSSNQHEFNGIQEFREIFGRDRITFNGKFLYFPDDEDQVLEDEGQLTWYDAREKHPSRTEYRLYYPTNVVISAASVGDLVVIGRTGKNELVVIVSPSGSTSEKQLLWLFGLGEVGNRFIVRDLTTEKKDLGFAGKYIITSLGFEIPESAPDYLEILLKNFPSGFPKTAEFSEFARLTLREISALDAPDETLMKLWHQEQLLFKTLENHYVEIKLKEGFGKNGIDVNEFIQFSLSVQNRRKSRAGHSFENHLAYIFKENCVLFSGQNKTERSNRPDFLFPGLEYYRDPRFNTQLLSMLGVKTTAKDRWRQVLTEADRIKQKHLITLEPSISITQTEEMIVQQLQLVVPEPLLETYSAEQQTKLMTLADFIEFVKKNQKKI